MYGGKVRTTGPREQERVSIEDTRLIGHHYHLTIPERESCKVESQGRKVRTKGITLQEKEEG